MPDTVMPQVRIHGVDDVRVDDVPVPEPGPDDVLIRVSNCGICGSDLGYIAQGGLTAPGVPMPLGHELGGTVAKTGANVVSVTAGQRVTVNPMANGRSIGNGGPEGGFAPWLLVRDVALHPEALLELPDTLCFERSALIEPLAVAMHGVRQSGAKATDTVAVLGAGPIGLCTVVVLRHYGISNVVVVDRSEQRLQVALQLGASAVCRVGQHDLSDVLKQEHGESALMGAAVPATDVYIEATGIGSVLEQIISIAAQGSRVAVLGVHKEPISLHPLDLLIRELHLVGSMAYPDEFPAVIELLSTDPEGIDALISHRFPVHDFAAALTTARDPEQAVKVMIELG